MDAHRAPSPTVAPPLRAPPQLPDENIEDILLRIPPDDPARLLRAALACRSWARLIASDGGFRRRYRQRHGAAAPMLGFVVNVASLTAGGVARFVSATPFRAARGERHGRVLLHRRPASDDDVPADPDDPAFFSVWDPIADEEQELPVLELPRQVQSWNAAVLCGAAATCDHVDCRPSGPFRVVFFGADADELFVHVYSSESGGWSERTASMNIPDDHDVEGYVFDETLPGVLAGNALYFVFLDGTRILKYDLAMATLSVIPLPPCRRPIDRRTVLITMEDGGLGSAEMNSRFNLTLWKLETTGNNPAVGWARSRVFDLKLHLHRDALLEKPSVVAFADIAHAVFLETPHGLYTFDLKTGESEKVMGNYFEQIVPFVSFYTPVIRAELLATSGEGSTA